MKPRQANHKKFAVLESRGPSGLSSQGIIQPYLHQQKYIALGQWVTTRNRKGELCILHSMMSPRSYILINDLCLAKELKETHTLIFIRGKTKWPSGLVLTLRSKARCTSAVLYESKFMLRAFLPYLLKKKKKKLTRTSICLYALKKHHKCTLIPPCNSLAQFASKTESIEQTDFLPASPAEFCPFHHAQQ